MWRAYVQSAVQITLLVLFLLVLLAGVALGSSPLCIQPSPRERLLVTGMTGGGKSQFVKAYVAPVWRVVIYDTEGEDAYAGYRWVYVDEFAARWKDWRRGVLQLAVRPRPGRRERGVGGEHELFCEAVNRVATNGSPLYTVHEEVSAYAGPSPSETYPWFTHLIVRGRKRGIGMLVSGQFLQLFPTTYRNNCSRLVAYQLPSQKAIDALEEIVGTDAELVHQLGPYQFIDWTRMQRARIKPALVVG